MNALFFRIIRHLLPSGKAWRLTIDKTLRRFFEGLSSGPADARGFVDDVYDDLDPQRTRELAAWEQQFGVKAGSLTDQERRDRLDALWKATGGQDPRYIEDTLRGAGFDIRIYEWWVPGSAGPNPPKRNPFAALGEVSIIRCGSAEARCGNEPARCGNITVGDGYLLVNRGLESPTPPAIPTDETKWPYILYIGGSSFDQPALIPAARRLELETLALQIAPTQQWLGMIVNFT